jgi:Spy/CpxP family protein refolding chaperone
MKKMIFSLLVLSMAVAVKAQEIPERKTERPRMMEGKRHHGDVDMKKLDLTEDQKVKFKTQNESFHQQMEELKKNDNITVKEWKAKAEALRKEHKAKIDGILTADQKQKLEKMKAEGKERQEGMMKERGEKMKTLLGLSPEQSSKMEANRKEMGEKMKALRENSSLSEDQKREQMRELHKKQEESMKSILTEEQLKKLKESHRQHPDGNRKKPAEKSTTI